MISESQQSIIHGLKMIRRDLADQIMRIDLLLINAEATRDQIRQLENCTTDMTHREISPDELERSGIRVLGTHRRSL